MFVVSSPANMRALAVESYFADGVSDTSPAAVSAAGFFEDDCASTS